MRPLNAFQTIYEMLTGPKLNDNLDWQEGGSNAPIGTNVRCKPIITVKIAMKENAVRRLKNGVEFLLRKVAGIRND